MYLHLRKKYFLEKKEVRGLPQGEVETQDQREKLWDKITIARLWRRKSVVIHPRLPRTHINTQYIITISIAQGQEKERRGFYLHTLQMCCKTHTRPVAEVLRSALNFSDETHYKNI